MKKAKKKAKANKKSRATRKAQDASKARAKKKAQATKKTQGTSKAQAKKKPQSTKKAPEKKKVGGTYPPIVVCQDGTIGQTDGMITFINNSAAACIITSCTMPCWPSPPAPNPVVPAAQNGVAGEKTVALICFPPTGTYSYTSGCCPDVTPPKIIVQ